MNSFCKAFDAYSTTHTFSWKKPVLLPFTRRCPKESTLFSTLPKSLQNLLQAYSSLKKAHVEETNTVYRHYLQYCHDSIVYYGVCLQQLEILSKDMTEVLTPEYSNEIRDLEKVYTLYASQWKQDCSTLDDSIVQQLQTLDVPHTSIWKKIYQLQLQIQFLQKVGGYIPNITVPEPFAEYTSYIAMFKDKLHAYKMDMARLDMYSTFKTPGDLLEKLTSIKITIPSLTSTDQPSVSTPSLRHLAGWPQKIDVLVTVASALELRMRTETQYLASLQQSMNTHRKSMLENEMKTICMKLGSLVPTESIRLQELNMQLPTILSEILRSITLLGGNSAVTHACIEAIELGCEKKIQENTFYADTWFYETVYGSIVEKKLF